MSGEKSPQLTLYIARLEWDVFNGERCFFQNACDKVTRPFAGSVRGTVHQIDRYDGEEVAVADDKIEGLRTRAGVRFLPAFCTVGDVHQVAEPDFEKYRMALG